MSRYYVPLAAVELGLLNQIGPDKWARAPDEGGSRYWAMLQGGPLDREHLKERIRDLRELYERAKADPQILKPMGMSLVDLELGLIKNIEWLKAGAEQHEAKNAAAAHTRNDYAVFEWRRDRLKYGSSKSTADNRARRK